MPYSVRFADAQHGWIGVVAGLLGTSDGGLTWTRQLHSQQRIDRIWALDTQYAWAHAADNTVYRTADGTHWAAIPATTPPIRSLQFVTPLVGWAVAVPPPAPGPVTGHEVQHGTVLSSMDGGVIWHVASTREMGSVCFVDDHRGWGIDGKQVFRTGDGGRSWTQIVDLTINDQGPWSGVIACHDLTTAWVQITEPNAGLGHMAYLVFHTMDGGLTWPLAFREAYTLGQTTPPNIPELGSYPSTTEMLRDGSITFITCTPAAPRQSVVIIDPQGRRTDAALPPTPSCVNGQVLDPEHVYAVTVGRPASVLATNDGGRSWEVLYEAAL